MPEDVGFYEEMLQCRGYERGRNETIELRCSYRRESRIVVVEDWAERREGSTVMFLVRGFGLPRYQGKVDKHMEIATILASNMNEKVDSHTFELFVK